MFGFCCQSIVIKYGDGARKRDRVDLRITAGVSFNCEILFIIVVIDESSWIVNDNLLRVSTRIALLKAVSKCSKSWIIDRIANFLLINY